MKASKDNSIYASIPFAQETTDTDWYKYQVTLTEKPKTINILFDTTNTTLYTTDEVVTNEKIVLYNSTDGFKEENLGVVTFIDEKCIISVIDSGDNDYLYDVDIDSNGNVFACGYSNYNFYIAKFDNDLNLISQYTIDSGNNDYLYSIATDSNGNVFICGRTYNESNSNYDFYIAKFDNDLNLISQYTIDSGNDDYLRSIVVDSNGNVFACGSSDFNFYIAKFDNNLNLISQYIIDNDSINIFHGITVDSNGNVFACGSFGFSFYIAKFDNNLNLISQYNIDSGNNGYLRSIVVDSNGNVFVCGYTGYTSYYSQNYDMYIAKFDNNLNLISQYTISNSSDDCLYGITVDSNDNIFVCGDSNYNFYIAKFDNDLNLISGNYEVENYIFTIIRRFWAPQSQSWVLQSQSWASQTQSSTQTAQTWTLTSQTWTLQQNNLVAYQTDISSFNLTNPPEKAWKEPTKVYIAMESNPDRCLYFDEDISDKIQNATTSYFEFVDTRTDLIMVNDKLIINGNEVTVSGVEYDSSTNTYKVTIPEQSSTITSVIIPKRTVLQTEVESRTLNDSYGEDYFDTTYAAVEKHGRVLRYRLDGNTDNEVVYVKIDLWKSSE